MISEREAYVYVQLPGTLERVPAALLRVQTLPDGTQVGRFRYGDRYLQRQEAVALDPFQLPLSKKIFEFTRLNGIPGAVRDASPDAWGRRVIEHKLERSPADLEEVDYLMHGPQDGAGYLSFAGWPFWLVVRRSAGGDRQTCQRPAPLARQLLLLRCVGQGHRYHRSCDVAPVLLP